MCFFFCLLSQKTEKYDNTSLLIVADLLDRPDQIVNTVNMKEKIIASARDVYLEYGYIGFSMRKVALSTGISATAIYRHFANKEELLFNVLLTGFRVFFSYLKRCEAETTPLAKLQRSSLEYMHFAMDHSGYYETMFMSSRQMTGLKNLNKKGAEEMRESYLYHHQLVVNCHFKNQNTDQIAIAIWAFGHGLISLFLVEKLTLSKSEFMATYKIQVNNYLSLLDSSH
jgi:AcrR family transcriptional regulator